MLITAGITSCSSAAESGLRCRRAGWQPGRHCPQGVGTLSRQRLLPRHPLFEWHGDREVPEQQQSGQGHNGNSGLLTLGRVAGCVALLRHIGCMMAAVFVQPLAQSLLLPLLILLVAWLQELLDQVLFAGRWNLPMVPGGSLLGVFTAPFSHSGFAHLLANSLVFVPLSWLVLLKGRRHYLAVWLCVYAMAIPQWLLWPTASHGLSGVVYGLLGYLLLIGWLEKRPLSLLLSGSALLAYGGVLPTLLPGFSPAGVSWIGHVSGFAGGLLAAWWMQER